MNISTIAETLRYFQKPFDESGYCFGESRLLESVRGKGGGLRLGRAAEEIRIGEVVRELEPCQMVECMSSNGHA